MEVERRRRCQWILSLPIPITKILDSPSRFLFNLYFHVQRTKVDKAIRLLLLLVSPASTTTTTRDSLLTFEF